MHPVRWTSICLVLAAAVGLPAIGAGAPATNLTAEIVYPIAARSAPAPAARKVAKLAHYTDFTRRPNVLMVTKTKTDANGDISWVRVQLPGRPNGRTAWIPAQEVVLSSTPYRIRVRVKSRKVDVLKRGKVVATVAAAVGTGGTPTPIGRWAVRDVYQSTTHFLGPAIIVLTANSPVLKTFAGGKGEVAIHGWPDASVMGRAVSHGCVRLRRSDVAKLAKIARGGTPVDVVNT